MLLRKFQDFCIEFTFSDQFNFERLIELNHVRDYKKYALSESDFVNKDICFRVLHVMSLMLINEDVENFGQKITRLTVCFVQLLSKTI